MSSKFIEKDIKKTENNYDNISKFYPLFAVYFQTLGRELKFQHIYYIPNAAAKEEVIKHFVKMASNNNMTLYTDK